MTPYPNHINEHNDDDGWGFYVVLDIEESFVNIRSLQKKYTQTVSALPTIEEGNEYIEISHEPSRNHFNSEETRIYLMSVICCLYIWILLLS